ncbi:hypothetical protein [Jiella pacifica]|uniref:Uncharacterized protein n=1 Tax=Jiella pacifica TaxID=2696469 RepID=A0A6N9T8A3_9HYPH|nr:hypothetical protein [Jiella pacifica]NDW07520.1 hypothetical protein [Jiella pacifica]
MRFVKGNCCRPEIRHAASLTPSCTHVICVDGERAQLRTVHRDHLAKVVEAGHSSAHGRFSARASNEKLPMLAEGHRQATKLGLAALGIVGGRRLALRWQAPPVAETGRAMTTMARALFS